MSKRKLRPKDKSLSVHHILATSRQGGNKDNLVLLPVEWHQNWHKLFVNLTVEEVHEFIDAVMIPDVEWNYKTLERLRRKIMENE